MTDKQTLVTAVRTLLRPIIRLMVALGLNARDFMEITKIVYVEVATSEYGKRGRPANVSRVALLTGLTRREVSRLRKVLAHDQVTLEDPMVPVGRVLAACYTDSQNLDSQGRPLPLPLAPDFLALVDEHRGDIPATTLVKELESHGAIQVQGGMVTVLSRYFMPFALDTQAVERFGRVMGDMGATICQNLLAEDRNDAMFEGRAVHELVASNSTEAFRNFLERRSMELLEEVDNWLADHSGHNAEATSRLGVGIYTIGELD